MAALVGVLVLLTVVCLRVLVSYDPFPAWGGDPMEMESPIVGLTPLGSVGLDVITLAASGAVLFGVARMGRSARLWQTLCLGAGGLAVWMHAAIARDASLDNLVLGSQWLASAFAAFSAYQACGVSQLRRLVVAGLLGLVLALAAKGALQVFVEQPELMRHFTDDKERILAAQGWSVGSPMALAYERRLSQPEASGWFGLSNVYSTLVASSFVALVGLLPAAMALKERRGAVVLIVVAGAAAAGAGVWLSHSKGGAVAAVMGLGLVVGSSAVRRVLKNRSSELALRRSLLVGSVVAVGVVVASLGAVVARGLVGERLHELSLLFRWFYMEGAAKVIASHPVWGVGPAGFKDAYMLVKPAISPEDVSSPHSVFFDFVATLGVGGLAWCLLFVAGVGRAGRGLFFATAREARREAMSVRDELRLLFLVVGAAVVAAALLESSAATLDSTLVRILGIAGSLAVAWAVLVIARDGAAAAWIDSALACAAVAGAAHAQIELTSVTPGANMWLFMLVAAAARPAGWGDEGKRCLCWPLAPALALVACVAAVFGGLVPVMHWELALRAAAAKVRDLPDLTMRAAALSAGKPISGDSAQALWADIAAAGARTGTGARALDELRQMAGEEAFESLYYALGRFEEIRPGATKVWPMPSRHWIPPHFETLRAATRLRMELAAMEQAWHETGPAQNAASQACGLAEKFGTEHPSSSAWAWAGTLEKARADLESQNENIRLASAAEAFEAAAKLAPLEPLYPLQLARIYVELSMSDKASLWASRAIKVNETLYLDPLRQFSKADLDELTRIKNLGMPQSPAPATPKP